MIIFIEKLDKLITFWNSDEIWVINRSQTVLSPHKVH